MPKHHKGSERQRRKRQEGVYYEDDNLIWEEVAVKTKGGRRGETELLRDEVFKENHVIENKKRKPRKPSRPFLGVRSWGVRRRNITYRQILEILLDPAFGQHRIMLPDRIIFLILRFFFKPPHVKLFVTIHNFCLMFSEFVRTYFRIDRRLGIVDYLGYCYRIRNDEHIMKECLGRFGMAFLVAGQVLKNPFSGDKYHKSNVTILHRIPFKQLVICADKFYLLYGYDKNNALNGSHGEKTETDDVDTVDNIILNFLMQLPKQKAIDEINSWYTIESELNLLHILIYIDHNSCDDWNYSEIVRGYYGVFADEMGRRQKLWFDENVLSDVRDLLWRLRQNSIARTDYVMSQLNGSHGEWTMGDDFLRELINTFLVQVMLLSYRNYQNFMMRLNTRVSRNCAKSHIFDRLPSLINLIFFFLINFLEIIIVCLSLVKFLIITYCFNWFLRNVFWFFAYYFICWPIWFCYTKPIILIFLIPMFVLLQYNDIIPAEDQVGDENEEEFDIVREEPLFERMPVLEMRQNLNQPNRVGAGKQKKVSKELRKQNRRTNLNNKGNGSKSKKKGEIQPLENDVQDEGEEVVSLTGADFKKENFNDFYYSKPPLLQMLFDYDELTDVKIQFDCHGAPFCGMVCIDIATSNKPDLDHYLLKVNDKDSIYGCGDDEYLGEYANTRGVNLVLAHPDNTLRCFSNNPGWKFVMIKFIAGEKDTDVGHYVLCTANHGSKGPVRATSLPFINRPIGLPSFEVTIYKFFWGFFRVQRKYELVSEFSNPSDNDERQSINQRDPIELIESYANVRASSYVQFLDFQNIRFEITEVLVRTWFDSLLRSFLHYSDLAFEMFIAYLETQLQNYEGAVGLLRQGPPARFDVQLRREQAIEGYQFYVNFFNSLIALFENTRDHLNNTYALIRPVIQFVDLIITSLVIIEWEKHFAFNMTISVTKAKRIIEEAEGCEVENRLKCLSLINQMRFVHDYVNIDRLKLNTITFCREVIGGMTHSVEPVQIERIAVNANNCHSFVPNIDIIRANQLRGTGKKIIGGAKFSKDKYNHVKRSRLLISKQNVPIAVAPTIVFGNSGKQFGPGLVSVTDGPGEVAAFMRSMTRDPDCVNDDQIADFQEFSFKFIDRIIKTVDTSTIVEKDCRDYFRQHYSTKRSKKYIDSMLEKYDNYLNGKADKDFCENKCFVKLENASKKNKGIVRNRPRLIMVMNSRLLIEYSQVIDVINQWNDSFFSKYQVKHMSPEEMVSKVSNVMNRKHIVTDYSSFECSIANKIRQLENYAIHALLHKSGLAAAKKRFLQDVLEARILKTKQNTFSLDSRNSGDFHTSWMNGLQNVLVSAYCYSKENPEDHDLVGFQMVAEGDDGIRVPGKEDVKIVSNLGYSFSVAVEGTREGDVDFLRVRWLDGKKFLNVGRSLKIAWVYGNKNLNRNKAKAIQRCAALSLHYTSPGHPILWAIVKRIGRETSGHGYFRGLENYVNSYNHGLTIDQIKMTGKNFEMFCEPDETMRSAVAMGTTGFPPISISAQLAIEEQILNSESSFINLLGLLDEYEDLQSYRDSDEWRVDNYKKSAKLFSNEMEQVLEIIKSDTTKMDIIDFKESYRNIKQRFGA